MYLNLKLLDCIQLNSHLHVNFACSYSEDGKIFILSKTGVYVLTLKGCMENVAPKFFFKKDHVKLSSVTLTEQIFDSNLTAVIKDFPRDDFYETFLDVGLSGNAIEANPIEPRPVSAMWSPRGIVEKTDGVLAVLTNLNNIEIYVEVIDENEVSNFTCVANFPKDITDHNKRSWKNFTSLNASQQFLEIKHQVNLLAPTAFTWSHVILKNQKACCVLFVGHRNGSISAWRFYERKADEVHESKLEFLYRYKTKAENITALHWFCRKSDAGGLSFGDNEGRLGAVSVEKLSTDEISFSCETLFCEEIDLKVDKITIVNHENITYVIAAKKNFLLTYAINDCGEVLQGKYIQIGDLYITDVLHYEKNILLVLSVCGLFKQLELSVINNELTYTEIGINLDIDSNKFRTHGFLISPNKVFLGVLAYPCKLRNLSKGTGFVNFFIFGNTQKDPFQILMNTTANNLRDLWDCFETLRVKCFKEKVFPWEGIDKNLNYDTLPLLKLKILRWIGKISEKVYTVIPYVMGYNMKAYVLLHYAVEIKLAVKRITKLLNIYFSEKKLTLFQMRSLDLLNFFLKEMVVKDILVKANLGETFIDEIYNVMRIANQLEYPPMLQCHWCGEKIIGTTCVPYHLDSRCAISLMPICITPGYKCPFCNCVVCKEMEKEYYPIFCPYCDVPMKRRGFEKKKYKEEILVNQGVTQDIKTSPEEVVTSDCYSDCITETINFSDIGENTSDYIIFSDSEDESETNEKLYEDIKKLVLSTSSSAGVQDEIVFNKAKLPEGDEKIPFPTQLDCYGEDDEEED